MSGNNEWELASFLAKLEMFILSDTLDYVLTHRAEILTDGDDNCVAFLEALRAMRPIAEKMRDDAKLASETLNGTVN